MSPQVSIIVPVYNTGQYVGECIESIINQSFHDWELLLIDDGSTDSSAHICEDFACRDNRIRYYQKPNGGVSSARNFGIDRAMGNYIMFVDSDDACLDKLLEMLYNEISKGFDFSVCMVASFSEQILNCQGIDKLYDLNSIYTAFEEFGLLHPPVAKLYKSKIIKNRAIKFDESLALGEDLCFNLDYLQFVKSATVVKAPLYNYRDTPGSLSKNIRADYADIQMYLIDRKLQFISQHGLKSSYRKQAPGMVRDMFLSLCRSKATTSEKTDALHRLKHHPILQQSLWNGSLFDVILTSAVRILPSNILIHIFK